MAASSKDFVLPADANAIPWIKFPALCQYFRDCKRYKVEIAAMRKTLQQKGFKMDAHVLAVYTVVRQETNRHCTRFNHHSGLMNCPIKDCKYAHECFFCDSKKHSATSSYTKGINEKGKPTRFVTVYDCPERQKLEEEYERLSSFYKKTEYELFVIWDERPSLSLADQNAAAAAVVQEDTPTPSSIPEIVDAPQERESEKLRLMIETLKKRQREQVEAMQPTVEDHAQPSSPRTVARRSSVVQLTASTESISQSSEPASTFLLDFTKDLQPTPTPAPAPAPAPASTPLTLDYNGLSVVFDNGKVIFGELGHQLRLGLPGGIAMSTLPLGTNHQDLHQLTVTFYYR